jgi:hypothetical protein
MSVQDKIARLAKFIHENPAFSSVPFMIVDGRPITPSEALAMLQTGRNVEEIMAGLSRIGLDLPWELCEEFYRRLVAARPEIKIYAIQSYVPAMSLEEALEHVRARDAVGETLVRIYNGLLTFIRERVDV